MNWPRSSDVEVVSAFLKIADMGDYILDLPDRESVSERRHLVGPVFDKRDVSGVRRSYYLRIRHRFRLKSSSSGCIDRAGRAVAHLALRVVGCFAARLREGCGCHRNKNPTDPRCSHHELHFPQSSELHFFRKTRCAEPVLILLMSGIACRPGSSLLETAGQNCQYRNSLLPPRLRIPTAAMIDIATAHTSDGFHSMRVPAGKSAGGPCFQPSAGS